MPEDYEFVSIDQPEWGIIGQGISDYNQEHAGDDAGKNLCFVMRTPDQQVVGGVIGATFWNWLQVNLMWVRADLRGQGFGHRLLELAEEEARKRGAQQAYLDTFSFQARPFYERCGYEVFGTLEDFPAGHQRFFMRKSLEK